MDDNERSKMFALLADIYLEQKDTTQFLETLNMGRSTYPESSELLVKQISTEVDYLGEIPPHGGQVHLFQT